MNFYIHKRIDEIISDKDEFPEKFKTVINGIEFVITEPFYAENVLADKSLLKKLVSYGDFKNKSVHLPFYDLNIASIDRNISEYSLDSLLNGINFASEIRAEIVVAHLGYNVFMTEAATDKWLKGFVAGKEKLEKKAESKGITVVWENTYEKDFSIFDKIFSINPQTKLCLDAGHCNCFAGFSSVEFLKKYKKSVIHIHLHDNFGKKDSHLAPGKGNINFKLLTEEIDKKLVKTIVFETDFQKFDEVCDNMKVLLKSL